MSLAVLLFHTPQCTKLVSPRALFIGASSAAPLVVYFGSMKAHCTLLRERIERTIYTISLYNDNTIVKAHLYSQTTPLVVSRTITPCSSRISRSLSDSVQFLSSRARKRCIISCFC